MPHGTSPTYSTVICISRKTASDAFKRTREYSQVIRFHALKIRRGSPLVGVQLPLPAPAQKPRPTRAPATFDLLKTKRLISPRKWPCDALVTGRGRRHANSNGQAPLARDRTEIFQVTFVKAS